MKKIVLFCTVSLGCLAPLMPAAGQGMYTNLYSFTTKSGIHPDGSFIEGADGVLYGTTTTKAAGGFGSVYSLTPPTKGTSWTITVLYAFQGGKDGSEPEGALVADSSGALYGTTNLGGSARKWGTVFKLTPPAKGGKSWTETVLYSFLGKSDGGNPEAGLLRGSDGTLYGTTYLGGSQDGLSGFGTVFKLAPPANGKTAWTQTVLHTFQGSDGANPRAALIADATGALYGTTPVGGGNSGGNSGYGTVFKMTPPPQGETQWTESVLYAFTGNADGSYPAASVTFDQSGNLFGDVPPNTGYYGEVYELSPPTGGNTTWTESIIFGGPTAGTIGAGVIFGSDGDLYGIGDLYGSGAYVFQLTPPAGGQNAWTEDSIYYFEPGSSAEPATPLLLTNAGGLAGTSEFGGPKNRGLAYQVTP
jgi:uncharacterized repeat protein (TIGR03803 family)